MKKTDFFLLLKKILPSGIKKKLRNNISIPEYDAFALAKTNPFLNEPDEVLFVNSPIKAGIIFNRTHYHKYWIAACREMEVSYRIIYLEEPNWMEEVQNSKCDVFLVWPDISTVELKQMFDERLRIMETELGLFVYPTVKEIWLYENKRVQYYWLQANNFPGPKTAIFYSRKTAHDFLENIKYPVVFKSNLGASASGVYIIKNKMQAIKMLGTIFRKGYKVKGSKGAQRQKGSLYCQEYLGNVKEWRMVRIGESYFGHGKDMKGQFHSGSGKANWDIPSNRAFELLHDITERGGFSSMDVDLFEDENGNFYVNELQTVFGNSIAKEQLKLNGVPGRMKRDSKGDFVFEAGDFCRNHLCNLRIMDVINHITHLTKSN